MDFSPFIVPALVSGICFICGFAIGKLGMSGVLTDISNIKNDIFHLKLQLPITVAVPVQTPTAPVVPVATLVAPVAN